MMEYSGFYGVGNFIDQHRDMRLDIDDMSYEVKFSSFSSISLLFKRDLEAPSL